MLCDLSSHQPGSFLAPLCFFPGFEYWLLLGWGWAGRLVQLPPGSSDALRTEAGS